MQYDCILVKTGNATPSMTATRATVHRLKMWDTN